jgi:S-adenosylmethionine decarboxylase
VKATGLLIAMDLYSCNSELLADYNKVDAALQETITRFNMEPREFHLDREDDSQEYAISVICTQGHVIFHLYPQMGFVTIDIFTCNENADPDGLSNQLRQFFIPDKVKITYLKRGDFGSEADMKPRRRYNIRNIRRVYNVGTKFKKIMGKPRSL